MKQIKTININAEKGTEVFDERVNTAIADGWTLTKRDVLPPCNCGSTYFNRMLYAELEKEIIPEDERSCSNCLYHDIPGTAEPCVACNPGTKRQNWVEKR